MCSRSKSLILLFNSLISCHIYCPHNSNNVLPLSCNNSNFTTEANHDRETFGGPYHNPRNSSYRSSRNSNNLNQPFRSLNPNDPNLENNVKTTIKQSNYNSPNTKVRIVTTPAIQEACRAKRWHLTLIPSGTPGYYS